MLGVRRSNALYGATMPELPEVEVITRKLGAFLTGKRILSVEVLEPKTIFGVGTIRRSSRPRAAAFETGLKNETIYEVARLGKNILFHFKSGKALVAHLKMTGQFLYVSDKLMLSTKHTRVVFNLNTGKLFFNDTRKFGYLLLYPSIEVSGYRKHFTNVGVEPLSDAFTTEEFWNLTRGKKGKLKSMLLSQKVVAGIGNIYADEICFAAGVRPQRGLHTLKRVEIEHIHASTRDILARAIEAGGSSISDYVQPDAKRGSYAAQHKVYGRAGQACFVCSTLLTKMTLAARTTVFCKRCQK